MRCNICYISIKEDSKQIKCPRCLNEFHFDHLAAWLLSEKICPICREELSDAFRDELRPKSDRDRDKLLRIKLNLSSLSDSIDSWEKKNEKRLKRQRKKKERDKETPRPKSNKLVPFLIFVVWVAILVYFLGS